MKSKGAVTEFLEREIFGDGPVLSFSKFQLNSSLKIGVYFFLHLDLIYFNLMIL
jgi:hypothetical protein